MKLILDNESATLALGASFYHALTGGCQIHLLGDLGAGKTTLVRGFLQAAGYQGTVKSPTFTLVEEYPLAEQTLVHFDLYRLADEEELEWMGIRDYMSSEVICFIEWPQRAQRLSLLSDIALNMTIKDVRREVIMTAKSTRGKSILENMNK